MLRLLHEKHVFQPVEPSLASNVISKKNLVIYNLIHLSYSVFLLRGGGGVGGGLMWVEVLRDYS